MKQELENTSSIPDVTTSLHEVVNNGLAQLFRRQTVQESHFAPMALLHGVAAHYAKHLWQTADIQPQKATGEFPCYVGLHAAANIYTNLCETFTVL